eukprot:snap_masked-scaffold_37-processed-gene-0.9-mRNA-1 protein AED:0.47 eAED:0.49 QI:0/0/0/1/1/1/2/0/265
MNCETCSKKVYFAEKVQIGKKAFHKLCFKCFNCSKKLTKGQQSENKGNFFCKTCYDELHGSAWNKFKSPVKRKNMPSKPSSASSEKTDGEIEKLPSQKVSKIPTKPEIFKHPSPEIHQHPQVITRKVEERKLSGLQPNPYSPVSKFMADHRLNDSDYSESFYTEDGFDSDFDEEYEERKIPSSVNRLTISFINLSPISVLTKKRSSIFSNAMGFRVTESTPQLQCQNCEKTLKYDSKMDVTKIDFTIVENYLLCLNCIEKKQLEI